MTTDTLVNAQARRLLPFEARVLILQYPYGTVADANNNNTVEFEWTRITTRRQCCHSGNPRMQLNPICAKAAEARLSFNVRLSKQEAGGRKLQMVSAAPSMLLSPSDAIRGPSTF